MFAEQVKKEDMRAVFLEYAWDMGWCDPCAADPLSQEELRKLGVFWLEDAGGADMRPGARRCRRRAQDVFVTRLHVRYDAEHFPEDLVFQETGDRTNFQGRYVLRHPWNGSADCDGGHGATASALAEAQRAGGADARHAHRLEHRRHPPEDGGGNPDAQAERAQVVAKDVGQLSFVQTGVRGVRP